jgi:para-aminobenzoate synthetase component 1
MNRPLFQAIPYQTPLSLYQALDLSAWSILLHSANSDTPFENTNRYSYICLEPFETQLYFLEDLGNNPDILKQLKLQLKNKNHQLGTIPNLPPFQTGLAGFLSYDLGVANEPSLILNKQLKSKLESTSNQNLDLPVLAVGFYHLIISFDHQTQKSWIISSGKEAQDNLNTLFEKIQNQSNPSQLNKTFSQKPTLASGPVTSNLTQTQYHKTIQSGIDYIRHGDIFEVNLAQKFTVQLDPNTKPIDIYKKLNQINPAPFSALFQLPHCTIISASP